MIKAGKTADTLERIAQKLGVGFAQGRKGIPRSGGRLAPPAPAKPHPAN